MRTKHIFVPALDVGEILPFAIKKKKSLRENIAEQERARQELIKFIEKLEKNYRESIYYIGMDLIEAKTYERFIFEKGGFFEIMTDCPPAMNSHFITEKKAKTFRKALVKTLKEMMPKNTMTNMFTESIEVYDEEDYSLNYDKWSRIKELK